MKEEYARILDITPKYFETTLTAEVRKLLRRQATQVPTEADLTGTGGQVLYRVGEYPFFWQYGAKDIEHNLTHFRLQIKKRFPDYFPLERLDYVGQNDEFEDVYYPKYYEVERILICLFKSEASRIITTKKLRTNGGDN
jgi:hypothetical protein